VTIGTSLVIIVINSIAGFTAHLGDVQIDWAVAGAFTATAMLASLVAGRLGRGLSDVVLKRGFALFVLLVAVYVAVKAIID